MVEAERKRAVVDPRSVDYAVATPKQGVSNAAAVRCSLHPSTEKSGFPDPVIIASLSTRVSNPSARARLSTSE